MTNAAQCADGRARLPVPLRETPDIVPNRERCKASIRLARGEDRLVVVVDFDGADGAPPEELSPEYAATTACEKCQLIHVDSGSFRSRSEVLNGLRILLEAVADIQDAIQRAANRGVVRGTVDRLQQELDVRQP
jgi:hypothetical protein